MTEELPPILITFAAGRDTRKSDPRSHVAGVLYVVFTMDYVSGDLSVLSNPFDRHFNYGSGNLDRRQVLTINYVYDLPFFRHRNPGPVRSLLGGWQLSGITLFETGTPLTPIVSDSGKQLGLGGGR